MSKPSTSESRDPVTRELIKNGLVTIADNVLTMVVRTSRSTVVKSNLDFSAAVCNAKGELVAQGLALPAHLGSIMPALAGCLEAFGSDIQSGDILLNNDPYSGGSHLNDFFMFRPIFSGGEIIAFLCLILHHTDVGGRVPGGNAADSTEIYQEGLRIPPNKIMSRGVLNGGLMKIIEANVRVSDRVLGDLRAQIAALQSGERELTKLVADYNPSTFVGYMDDLIDYTERLTRLRIREFRNATAEFTDWIDDDGTGVGPVRIHCSVTIEDDHIIVDFTGTSPQSSGAINPNYWFTVSNSYAAIRTLLDAEMPNNAGFYRAVKVIAPEGCFVNPTFPAPVGARGLAGFRVRSVVLGALATLVPDRLPACTGGSEFGIVIAGRDAKKKDFLYLEFHNSTGHGGGPTYDGQDAGPYCLGNLANVPVEMTEAEMPIRIEEYALLPDTGGTGRFRGALGVLRQYRLLCDEATIQVRSDRQVYQPWGLFGGGPGSKGKTMMNPGAGEVVLPSKFVRKMQIGNVFRVEMPGSGGYGDPLDRDPSAVLDDYLQDKITTQHAREAYGVCIDPNTRTVLIDDTTAARAKLRQDRTS